MYHVYPLVTEKNTCGNGKSTINGEFNGAKIHLKMMDAPLPRYGKLDGAIIDIESGDLLIRSIKIQTWDPHVRHESVGKQK
jgi:hypothetical protein